MNGIVIKKLSPKLSKDYLLFFDDIAFRDNPDWSHCYCRFPQAPHEDCEWKNFTKEQNRAAVIELLKTGKLNGFLAYTENMPIGWCNAGPRTNYTTTPDYHEPEAEQIGSITCFVIAKEYRGKGVARLLLKTALEVFKSEGYKYAEGYPLEKMEGESANHWGPKKLYSSEGFEQFAIEDDMITMRKKL